MAVSSSSGMFAKRGNPWITRKEGVKDFGRNPETEDAEYDFDHRFHETANAFGKPKEAPKKEEHKEDKPEPLPLDHPRRTANVLRRMNAAIHKAPIKG